MTVYTKTMAQALREVYLVEDNMEQMRKAAGGAMQTIKFRDGKLKVDSFTASAIMKVYEAVNSKNKKSMENIINKGTKSQMMKLQSFAMKQIKSEYDPEDKGPLATVDEGAELEKHKKEKRKTREKEIDDWAAAKKADLKKEHSNGKPHKHPHDDEEDEDEIDQQQQQNAQEAAGTVNLKSPVMLDLLRLYNKAMSEKPNSKKQKEYRKEIEKVRKSMGMTEDVSVVVDAEELTEGTWHIAKDMSGLKILMKKPIKLGNEGDDATEVISPFIGDDQLYDALYASGKKNPNGDARPVIKKAMKRLRIREEVEEAVTAKNYDKKRNEFTQGIIGKIKNDNEAVKTLMKELGVSKKGAMDMVKQTRAAYKDEDRQQTDEGENEGLWDNINNKRKRIKAGSGEKMRKKGDPGAPTDAAIKRSQEEVEEGKLPSHLAKFFDPKTGDMKPEVAKRVKKIRNKSKIKDVTPKGYGPKEEVELNEGSMHDVIVMKKGRVGVGVIATDIASIKKKEKQGWKIEGVIEKGSKILHKEPKRIMKAIKGGDKLNIGEARQLKDPKKEMMVKSKDSGVIVIDKKDFKKYQKKGYFQVEEVELDEGKMGQMHQMMKDGKSAEQIAKAMKLDLKTVRELMKEGLGNIAKAGAKAIGRGAKGAVKTAYKTSPIGQWHGAVKTGVKKVKAVAGRVKQASQKGEEFDPVEEGAAADARRAIGRDPQLGRKKDSADDDMSATDDDVKAASKNIMMQLRKSQTLRGKFDVEFMDRKKHKVPSKIAQAVTARFMALKRPAEKQEFQNKISKSYKDMLKALDEAINNEGFIFVHKNQTILERIDTKLMERKNG